MKSLQTALNQIVLDMPKPFSWVQIPPGEVTIVNDWDEDPNVYISKGETRLFRVDGFYIGKYPITNAQYACFINEGGYLEKSYWTEAGWRWREEQNYLDPAYWRESTWNGPSQPVIGVAWYEAMAFCTWLRVKYKLSVILPTEQQWQRAAQGDDKRAYPWGNKWELGRCNSKIEPDQGKCTTPVDYYEHLGCSPFGVVDMSGNVWEWCLNVYNTDSIQLEDEGSRTMRGGAWNHSGIEVFQTWCRSGNKPWKLFDCAGFRIAIVSSNPSN